MHDHTNAHPPGRMSNSASARCTAMTKIMFRMFTRPSDAGVSDLFGEDVSSDMKNALKKWFVATVQNSQCH